MPNVFTRKVEKGVVNTAKAIGSTVSSANATPAASHIWTVIGLIISNTSAQAIKVSASLYDATQDYYLVKDADIPIGGSLVVVGGDQKVVLVQNDNIRVITNSVASTCDVVMSILDVS